MAVNSFIQHLSEGVYDPGIFKAFFLAGGPGSGKSFVTQSAFAGTGLKVVNSDTTFERNLKKANLSLSMPDEEEYFRNIVRAKAKMTTATVIVIIKTGNRLRDRSRKRPLIRKFIMIQFFLVKHL